MKSIIFDFDGVIVNSNKLKTSAFYDIFEFFKLPKINEFINYHINNGGVSALNKFHFYKNNLNLGCKQSPSLLEGKFREIIKKRFNKCEYDPFFKKYKPDKNLIFHINSGGNLSEINNYLEHHNLKKLFKGFILGGENSKIKNFNLINSQFSRTNSYYLGDSYNDYISSKKSNIKFFFISQWSESPNWRNWSINNLIKVYSNIEEFFIDNDFHL